MHRLRYWAYPLMRTVRFGQGRTSALSQGWPEAENTPYG